MIVDSPCCCSINRESVSHKFCNNFWSAGHNGLACVFYGCFPGLVKVSKSFEEANGLPSRLPLNAWTGRFVYFSIRFPFFSLNPFASVFCLNLPAHTIKASYLYLFRTYAQIFFICVLWHVGRPGYGVGLSCSQRTAMPGPLVVT